MQQYTATQISQGVWRFNWTADPSAYYQIWLNGVLLHTTAQGGSIWTTDEGGPTDVPPPIEIHNTADGKAQSQAYSPRSVLQWRGVVGASGYQVERVVSGTWTPVANPSERGAGWYIFNTGTLVDDVVNQFRIKALDGRAVAGDALEFNVAVTCNPVPPSVEITVSGGNIGVAST